jgi:N-acetyl-anhydromuramyl-L-alanine amidase AmpD
MIVIDDKYDWAWTPADRSAITHVILHHAGEMYASPQDIHNRHIAQGRAGIPYHYYVRKDGKIFKGRPESKRGGHTAGLNGVSIGICFEGDFERELMPVAQIISGRELVRDLRARYPGIIVMRHSDADVSPCPGKYFPFSAFFD